MVLHRTLQSFWPIGLVDQAKHILMGGEEGGESHPGHVLLFRPDSTTSTKGTCSQASILVSYEGLHDLKGSACLYGNVIMTMIVIGLASRGRSL